MPRCQGGPMPAESTGVTLYERVNVAYLPAGSLQRRGTG